MNRAKQTRVSAKNYVLHICDGERTLCGRSCAKVNCYGNAEEVRRNAADLDMTCRACAQRWAASSM